MSERSYLFIPRNRPERFDKVIAVGAYVVIVDLEDAVAPADKIAARGRGRIYSVTLPRSNYAFSGGSVGGQKETGDI